MFRTKLNIYYIGLILTSLLISGVIISQVSVKKYKQLVEDELKTNASAAAFYIEENEPENYNDFTVSFSKKLNSFLEEIHSIRVTIINPDGIVIGDSVADIATMDNHMLRPEIIDANNNGLGMSIRKSDTTNINYMYLAQKLNNGDLIRLSVSLAYIKSLTSTIYLYTLIAVLISLAFSVLISWRLSYLFSKPIAKLSYHSKEISNGNYSHRIPPEQKPNELSRLIDSFNKMTEDLEASFSEASNRNQELQTLLNTINESIVAVGDDHKILFANDRIKNIPGFEFVETNGNFNLIKNSALLSLIEATMSDKTTIQKNIKCNNLLLSCFASYYSLDDGFGVIVSIQDITRLKQLEKLRYEFVSNVTHELNTPLTSIKGFIETLKEGAINNKETAMKFLDIIDIESDRLSNLINDILTLSSIENENKTADMEDVNIRKVANDALILLSNNIREKRINTINNIDESFFIRSNSDRIKQLFINLIDNAIKYNKLNGCIELYAVKSNNMIEIHVTDTGIGIDEANLTRLFERFYRVDKGRSREMGGTGLGLSIVKHIAVLYGGSVSVKSTPGEGSDFYITFPSK